VAHKWGGEISMCGFKKDVLGRPIAMIVRGRQDVSRMYQTIHGKMELLRRRGNI
jgi:hypothetical protein